MSGMRLAMTLAAKEKPRPLGRGFDL